MIDVGQKLPDVKLAPFGKNNGKACWSALREASLKAQNIIRSTCKWYFQFKIAAQFIMLVSFQRITFFELFPVSSHSRTTSAATYAPSKTGNPTRAEVSYYHVRMINKWKRGFSWLKRTYHIHPWIYRVMQLCWGQDNSPRTSDSFCSSSSASLHLSVHPGAQLYWLHLNPVFIN